jgi:hypothetical protein
VPRLTHNQEVSMRSSLYGGLAVAAILTVGLVLVACGSSSDNSTTSTTAALSKAAFLKQGNAICKKGNQQINQAGKAIFSAKQKPTSAQRNKFATAAVTSIQSQINQIRALGAPSGDQAKVTAMMATSQANLNKVKQNPALITSNQQPFAPAAKLLHAYGLTVCASGA